jgi:nicotinamidase/pyrazinamidase
VQELGPGSALVVVDLQNDFADPRGSLYVRGGEELVAPINKLVRRASEAGAFVVYTQDWHPESTPHFAKDGGIWPVHCVAGTWGAELVPGLVVVGPLVRKGTAGEDGYSGFGVRDVLTGATRPTKLAALLADHGVGRVSVVGLATDYCVKYTALDAVTLGFETTVLSSYCRAVELRAGDGAAALEALAAAGVEVLTSEEERR